jgi:transposase-like protein
MAKARRRRFSPTEIAKILADLNRLPPGPDRSAYLRNGGLYSSQVALWRRRQEQGQVEKRGRKAKETNPLEKVVATKERRIRELERKLKRAELMLEIQKKAQEALATFQEKDEDSGESA